MLTPTESTGFTLYPPFKCEAHVEYKLIVRRRNGKPVRATLTNLNTQQQQHATILNSNSPLTKPSPLTH